MPPLVVIHQHKRILGELRGIREALERVADVLESKLLGKVRTVDSREEGEVLFQTDEDFARLEQLEQRHIRAMGELGVDVDLEEIEGGPK